MHLFSMSAFLQAMTMSRHSDMATCIYTKNIQHSQINNNLTQVPFLEEGAEVYLLYVRFRAAAESNLKGMTLLRTLIGCPFNCVIGHGSCKSLLDTPHI